MKLFRFACGFAFVTGSLLVGGCGDDGAKTVDAAIDAPPDARVPDYGSDEGGEVRVEYMRFPNGMVGARGTAFFYKNSGTTKFFPFLNLNGCTDLTAKTKWPVAQNPAPEREYYDVGDNVTVSGGPSPFVIAKNTTGTPATDPVGRNHPANDWYFNPVNGMTDTDGGMYLPADTYYDVALPGSATYAAKTYTHALYMPADFALTTPAFAGTINFPPATAQTFTFTNPTSHPPEGVDVQSIVAFTGANGPAVICAEPADGSVTVPADMMDIARTAYPTGGQLARQTVSHVVQELVDETGAGTGRRLDFLGVWCYAGTAFTTVTN
jgi:hypothetical protein